MDAFHKVCLLEKPGRSEVELVPKQYLFLEISVTKDNPAFSMINDSDEEVVYGSEDESRRPLTVGNKNDYDSD